MVSSGDSNKPRFVKKSSFCGGFEMVFFFTDFKKGALFFSVRIDLKYLPYGLFFRKGLLRFVNKEVVFFKDFYQKTFLSTRVFY